ncbi:MAG TPA: hypothetical protein VMX18_02955 [Candidatus Bipolaricaulota bacterium]|nr:hypothetical protein [Candidatus Bipolaricaulota bacterium]
MISRIIIGFLIAGAGFMITWKTDAVYRAVGSMSLGEKFFGAGGTRFLLKLIGIIAILIGFTVIVNLQNKLLGATLGRLF